MKQSLAPLAVFEQHSFSDQVAQYLQATQGRTKLMYTTSVKQIWEHINQGCRGIIPIENSSDGVVWPHLDKLLKGNYTICSEVNLRVNMCVGGLQKTTLEQVQRIFSHPKALGQCSDWIHCTVPNAEEVKTDNTASAASMVRRANDATQICLASREAIAAQGLQVLQENVANNTVENITDFLEVSNNGPTNDCKPECKYHIASITPENYDGSLCDILSIIKHHRIGLHKIHSRSIGHTRYTFFMQMTKNGSTDEFATMLKEIKKTSEVQWLGSYDHRYDLT